MTRPRWTTLRPFRRRRRRRVHVVLWGARAGDLQAGSLEDRMLAQLLTYRHRMFSAARKLGELGAHLERVDASLAKIKRANRGDR